MRNYIDKQGREYEFKKDYRDDEALRKSFNELTEKTYGFNFEKWYEEGYWQERYNPYTFFYEGKAAANVSVNVMEFDVLGKLKTYVQLGTVMTDKEFRGRGLSRRLIEIIIDEWQDKCDLIYLFANDSVLDFYPKFGFAKAVEYKHTMKLSAEDDRASFRKLDMDNENDKKLLYDLAASPKGVSKISMQSNAELIMFYCINFMRDNIYYIEEYNAAAVCEFADDTLFVMDILKKESSVDLKKIINCLGHGKAHEVKLGFTPVHDDDYEKEVLNEEDTTLFIMGRDNVFKDNLLRFPELSHA